MHRGFTLIELLVVMTISAILLSVVLLSVSGAGPERAMRHALAKVGALIGLACEQAQLDAESIGLQFSEERYFFLLAKPSAGAYIWEPMAENGILGARKLDSAFAWQLMRDGLELELDGNADKFQPQIVCLASGELTPFTLLASHPGVEKTQALTGQINGEIVQESRARD